MTIPAGQTSITQHTGNGVADTFDYEFKITDKSDLLVTSTDTSSVDTVLTVDVDYTVTGVGNDAGGNITLVAGALTTGYKLTIEDNVQADQLTPYGNQSAFFGSNHENSFDKLTRLAKKLFDSITRSVRLPSTISGVDPTLPDPVALNLFRWNEAATGLESVTSAEVIAGAAFQNYIADSFIDGSDFTAGTTTQLTLSSNPGVEANTQVYFDGVYQEKTEYSVLDTTITFSSAIPAGVSSVEIVHGTALPTGTTDTANVNHSEDGTTYNLATYLQNRHVISVRDFGAVGDGVTDDSAAIQDAINNFDNVYFPSGTYKVTSLITIATATTLFSDNRSAATIKFVSPDTSNKQMFNITADDVTFRDVAVFYNGLASESAQIFDVRGDNLTFDTCDIYSDTSVAKSNTVQGFQLGSSDFNYLTLRNSKFHDMNRVFLRSNASTNNVTNIVVDGCEIYNLNTAGVNLNFPNGSINYVRIVNNHFHDFLQGAEQIFSGGASLKNAIFSGNTYDGTGRECIHLEEEGENITITGNVFNITDLSGTEELRGVFLTDNNISGTYAQPTNVSITGNVFKNRDVDGTGTYTGIQLAVDASGENACKHVTIKGNTIEGYDRGIRVDYGEPIVEGNQITDCAIGIYANQPKPSISNNFFNDCPIAVEGGGRGGIVGKNVYNNCTTVVTSTGGERLNLSGFVLYVEADIVVADTATVNTNLGIDLGADGDADGNAMLSAVVSGTLYKNRLSALNWDGATLTDTQTYVAGAGAFTATLVDNSGELSVAINNTTGAEITVKGVTLDFNGFYTSNS